MIDKKIKIPKESVLFKQENKFDYLDSFKEEINNNSKISIEEIGKVFFESGPKWSREMFAFRNNMVKLFGLKTGERAGEKLLNQDFRIGNQIGIFKIFDKTSNELILGEDDKHLDFRVSLLFNEDNLLIISTTVMFHNWLGRLYFLLVRPFHKLIVTRMLKNMVSRLETNK